MNPAFVSQQLTQRNYRGECAAAVEYAIEQSLRRMGLTFASPDAVHRLHIVMLHADATERVGGSTEEKERALWW